MTFFFLLSFFIAYDFFVVCVCILARPKNLGSRPILVTSSSECLDLSSDSFIQPAFLEHVLWFHTCLADICKELQCPEGLGGIQLHLALKGPTVL